MNDYIITIDSSGQPYIEHAFGRNRGANAQHKYILKIGEGAKARYFYTQEAVRAYLQNARANASDAAKQVASNASDAAKQVASNASDAAKRVTSNASDTAKQITGLVQDKVGVTAERELKTAQRNLSSAIREAESATARSEKLNERGEPDSNGNLWFRSENEAHAAAEAELKAIQKTNEIENQRRYVEAAASRYAETPLGRVKSITERMKEEFQRRRESSNKSNNREEAKDGKNAETRIEEKVIPETRIEEKVIPETRIEEKVIPEKTMSNNETISDSEFKKLQRKANRKGMDALTQEELNAMFVYIVQNAKDL